jgi:hypothetical protein
MKMHFLIALFAFLGLGGFARAEELMGSAEPLEALLPGIVVVEVRDFQGAPAPGKSVIAVVQDATGRAKEHKIVSDESGRCRFEGLPTDPLHQVSFFFVEDGMVLAETAPMRLPVDAGRRVEMRLPLLTDDPARVEARSYSAVFSKKHSRVSVSVSLALATQRGVIFRSKQGLRIPLPQGALAPSVPGDDTETYARVEADAVYLLGAVNSDGVDVELRFEMQPVDGRLEYEHPLPWPLPMVQLISSWTDAGATLSGDGMPPTELREMHNGLVALVTMTRDVRSGLVRATFTGLDAGFRETIRWATLLLCALLLCFGVGVWIRDRTRRANP